MTAPLWVGLLFPDNRPLFHRVTMAGRTAIEQWTLYEGPAGEGLHHLVFLAEIDRDALGIGVGPTRSRGDLVCNDRLEPVHYRLQAAGTVIEMRFQPDRVEVDLPDGTSQQVETGGGTYLADGNFPGTMALVYAVRAGADASPGAAEQLRLRLFVAGSLAVVPYETYPVEDGERQAAGWHRTSHRSEVRVTPAGVAVAARMPDLGLEELLVADGPPPPDWPETLAPPQWLSYRPPPEAAFRLEDVAIDGPVTAIGATLSIPPGPGPFPAALFISGSGTHDRHGIAGEIDIGTHELMDDLAGHGILGLRFDTRGAGTTKFGADGLDRGLESDIADARACLAYLAARPETTDRPLFLIGHSQGATVALALAGESAPPRLAGLVLMAGMGRDLDEVLADQVRDQGRKLGLGDAQIAAQQADLRKVADLIRAGSAWDEDSVPHHLLAMFPTETWFRDFLRHPSTELIRHVACPILLCQGEADFQISPERDAGPLLDAARQAGKECAYALFPGLDHLFKRSAGQSSLAEYHRPRPVAPEFLECLRGWLAARIKS